MRQYFGLVAVVAFAAGGMPGFDGAEGWSGRVEIARIGLVAPVLEGTDAGTPWRAVGQIAKSGVPGRPGNIGLAGHRDTHFRPLAKIREGDVITLRAAGEVLTLVTCHPFAFVGAATNRFIVRAEGVR